ncbi:hypothetical protein GCM10020221_05000 [Streptomyces thioluteus]|uniref:Glutamate--cysteine ligase n=1 Tax=Streptomyces thioluteus TaxID=66431 RepID=A0ABN3WEV3_STRTU
MSLTESGKGQGASGTVPTFGVEEEFFLADSETRATVARAPDVIKYAQERLGDRVGPELFTTTVETRTCPVGTLDEMRRELRRLRRGVGEAADEAGCRVVASGTPVVPFRGHREIVEEPRYRELADRYGPFISDDRLTGACACHVHVAVPGREEAVRLCDHLRPWLPVLQAVAANSPFQEGRDSGFASWRALHFGRWPHVGPTPLFRDAAAYDALVGTLIDSGMLQDRKHVYWYARPSEKLADPGDQGPRRQRRPGRRPARRVPDPRAGRRPPVRRPPGRPAARHRRPRPARRALAGGPRRPEGLGPRPAHRPPPPPPPSWSTGSSHARPRPWRRRGNCPSSGARGTTFARAAGERSCNGRRTRAGATCGTSSIC